MNLDPQPRLVLCHYHLVHGGAPEAQALSTAVEKRLQDHGQVCRTWYWAGSSAAQGLWAYRIARAAGLLHPPGRESQHRCSTLAAESLHIWLLCVHSCEGLGGVLSEGGLSLLHRRSVSLRPHTQRTAVYFTLQSTCLWMLALGSAARMLLRMPAFVSWLLLSAHGILGGSR